MTDGSRDEPRRGPTLLCAGTDPPAATRLADVAASLLDDRPVVVLAIWQPPPPRGGLDAVMDALYDTHADLRAAARHAAADAARTACDVLDAHGLDVSARVCADDRAPWHAILEHADEIDAGVIVAGTGEESAPHPGSLGSQARALAHRTRRPLLLAPGAGTSAAADAPAIFAYDGSAAAGHALREAAQLLRRRPALLASVWETAPHAVGIALLALPSEVARKGADAQDEESRRIAEGRGSAGAARLADAGWPCEIATLPAAHGVPAAIIGAAGEHHAAIVVTGTRGRSRIAAALLGGNAEGILRHAGRPVLLVPPAEGE